jgi:hypothetical protein
MTPDEYIRTPHDELVIRVAELEARVKALEYAALSAVVVDGDYYEKEPFDPTTDYSKK